MLGKDKLKKILIMSDTDPRNDPRPNRMINWLKGAYNITVVGWGDERKGSLPEEVRFFRLSACMATKNSFQQKHNPIRELLKQYLPTVREIIQTLRIIRNKIKNKLISAYRLLKRFILLRFSLFENIIESDLKFYQDMQKELIKEDFDLIISHDLTLLPLVFKIKKKAKVLLDAREFYPRNHDDLLSWRLLYKPLNEYLCAEYLPCCDKIITVSDGLSQGYNGVYKVQSEVVMSLPPFHNLTPMPTNGNIIKIIHHGNANRSRNIETMIEMMGYVDDRFFLNLMLIPVQKLYWEKIVSMVKKRKNIRIIPPVRVQEIIPFTNSYDIGLFLCRPTNFNLEFMLPNKLFEFIQARLMIAIGPSVEMRKIVEKNDCGIVACDFNPKSLAQELNKLTKEKIRYYKEQSHKASRELNAEANSNRINEIVYKLVGR